MRFRMSVNDHGMENRLLSLEQQYHPPPAPDLTAYVRKVWLEPESPPQLCIAQNLLCQAHFQ